MSVDPRDRNAQFVLETKPGTGFSRARQLLLDYSGRDGGGGG